MPGEQPDFEQQLNMLRSGYAARLPERAQEVTALWSHFCQNPERGILESLRNAAHKLAGSSATYSFTEISRSARQIEQLLLDLYERPASQAEQQQIWNAVRELHRKALRASDTLEQVHETFGDGVAPTRLQRGIILLDDDVDLAYELERQLGYFGYQIHVVTRLQELPTLASQLPARALIADLMFPEGGTAGAEMVKQLRENGQPDLPVVFVSSRSDLEARLAAVRAGGSAYITKPVDMARLVDALDRLTGTRPQHAFRVLIVDDDSDAALIYEMALNGAGMQTEIVQDPLLVLTAMESFQPDLILLDMYMPGCNGAELAAAIRQQEQFVGMPIVFLSGEQDRDIQLQAMQQGGDDFLTKPIAAEHLISTISSRAQRARGVHSQLARDGLTGLLNRAMLEQQLLREIARAQRHGTLLSLAMLDIDHFKRINDTFGHPVGDRVLKSVARLLYQELRRSDIIGRYGGEEFAVILPDTDGRTAVTIMERLRRALAEVQYQSGNSSFKVTVSAGVAEFITHDDPAALMHAADDALYDAKRSGRNRVTLAAPQNTAFLDLQSVTADGSAHQTAPVPPLALSPLLLKRDGQGMAPAQLMVVDDDPDIRQLLGSWLAGYGFTVQLVESGEAAIELLDQQQPDLILLDILMPGLNGLQVLEHIRDIKVDAAVILSTAFGSEQVAISALRQGADDYMRKPLRPRELQAVLERTLTRLGLRRQNQALQRQLDQQRALLEQELSRAARIQAELLPSEIPALPGFELSARCIPAHEVGGDFYDWHVPAPGLLNLTFGDVMGKGMPAALLMSAVRTAFRAAARQTPPHVNVQYAAQALLADLDRTGSFVTLFHAQLHIAERQIDYIDAGHGLCVVRRASGLIERLQMRGVPLGVPTNGACPRGTLKLHPGDALIVFSDGLLSPWPQLAEQLELLGDLLPEVSNARTIVNRLLTLPTLIGPRDDDLTVLALYCQPDEL